MKTTDEIVRLRAQAEEAVAGMPVGDLRVKAFEVILGHLLEGDSVPSTAAEQREPTKKAGKAPERPSKAAPVERDSLRNRILVLREEGFFKAPKGIGETRKGLQEHGWIHDVTAMSGPLQALVQKRDLRRTRGTDGTRGTWKYVNP
jgi:hypothetical protein